MNSILLLAFNNYSNRQVKLYDSLYPYLQNSASYFNIDSVNFNPNDGVTTEIILGKGTETQLQNLDVASWDYLIVYTKTQTLDGPINSRWFILNVERTRGGQYKLTLQRDVLADYYQQATTSPAFVEKGWLRETNPLIFNSEDIQVNQIKKQETLLKDETACPWLVMYVAKNAVENDKQITVPADNVVNAVEVSVSSIDNFVLYPYQNSTTPLRVIETDITKVDYTFEFRAYNVAGGGTDSWKFYYSNKNANAYFNNERVAYGTSLTVSSFNDFQKTCNDMNTLPAAVRNLMAAKAKTEDIIAAQTFSTVENWKTLYDNKIIKLTNGKYYSVRFRSIPNNSVSVDIKNASPSTDTYAAMASVITELKALNPRHISGNPNDHSFGLTLNPVTTYVVDIEELLNVETTGTLKPSHRPTTDALYDIYCIPYGEITIEIYDSDYNITTVFTSDANSSMNIVNAIKEELGSSVYDIQLVPYCPLRDLMPSSTPGRPLLVTTQDEDKVYTFFRSDGGTIRRGILYYATLSNFEFNINQPISIQDYTGIVGTIDDTTKIKMSNQCDAYRLVSPNFNGQFELSVAKNGGIDYFNVDCTYKPYMPYIHVNPNFKNLYGEDFNDPRGLICGGNFSIDQISQAFTEYELQNKNYQQIFDRQLQSLDTMNNLAMGEQITKAAIGSVTGAAGGAVGGFMMGGVPGAVAGGIVGGVTSVAGGVADSIILAQRQQEQRSLMSDIYNYNLQNIKAMPYSLTKVSAINNNNKIFPFIEYYSCTDEEKKVFKNKIEEQGITVKALGTIQELCLEAPAHDDRLKWFQGRIIRFKSLYTTSRIAEAINSELQRGVYF